MSRRIVTTIAAGTVLVTSLGAAPTSRAAAGPAPMAPVPGQQSVCTASSVRARMSLEQRVGQLFMVGTPATSASSTVLWQISTYHVGNVMLTGRSTAGVTSTAAVSRALQSRVGRASTAWVPLWVSTDQEGGYVQVLKGTGFSTMPSGKTQGTYATSTLQSYATTWGRQLKGAGVTMNLAPVTDVVPAWVTNNPPILRFSRQYGRSASTVKVKTAAFIAGMRAAGVEPVVKHFPGLGRVGANTDDTSGVHDTSTTKTGDVTAFTYDLGHGARALMMSSAIYDRIDRGWPAALSYSIIMGWLRHQIGFTGVVMTDDFANAKAVTGYSRAFRSTRFIESGGDIILLVSPAPLPDMYRAVLARARTDAGFRAKVDAAVLRVLVLKEREGLLAGSCR